MRVDVILCGGGLAGCLTALALAKRGVALLLIEEGASLGGEHVWSYFDGDIAPEQRWLVDPMTIARWPDHEVAFPARKRKIGSGYNSMSSDALDAHVRATLRPEQVRLGARVASVGPDSVTLESGETIAAGAVIDARGAANLEALTLGWQKFIGRTYRFAAPHGIERPVVMDATVEQLGGYRFVYLLPFSPTELMVEDTYYADTPDLDRAAIGGRIDDYLAERGLRPAAIEKEESGVLPVTLGGDFEAFWPQDEQTAARIGLRGGFFHPTTGYSLPDAVRIALRIAALPRIEGRALAAELRAESARLWRERTFYRAINRMLFRAATPDRRYRVLEHFYRLDPDLIARFYAARLTPLDKMKIMSGRPPVPILRALSALWKAA